MYKYFIPNSANFYFVTKCPMLSLSFPGCSPVAKAPRLGRGDRRCKSSHPDQAVERPL